MILQCERLYLLSCSDMISKFALGIAMSRFLSLAGSLVFFSGIAFAEPMDKATCAAMSAEYQGLIAAGLKADLEKGPEWGKANLNEERLKLIARLIEVEETLAFRCRTLAIPVKRREAVSGLDPAATGELDTASPAGASAAKAKQKKTPVAPSAAEASASASNSVTGSTPEAGNSASKPNVIRLKSKTSPAKKKSQPQPQAEKPGLFILE